MPQAGRRLSTAAAILAAACFVLDGCSTASSADTSSTSSADSGGLDANASQDGPEQVEDGGIAQPADGGGSGGRDGSGPTPDAGESGSSDAGAPMQDGDTAACPAAAEGGVALAAGTPLAHAIVPNPIVSLGKPATTTTRGYDPTPLFADPAEPNDVDNVSNFGWQPAPGESMTIHVGSGPSELLMTWEIAYADYAARGSGFGLPYDYEVDVSPDGSTWTHAVPRTTSTVRSSEVKFAFTGNAYVRFTQVSTTSDRTIFTSMKIFDASNGTEDTWLVAGMGPSRFVYNDLQAPGFGHLVNGCRPKYYPALVNISDVSVSISDFLTALQAPAATNWLSLNPDFHFWILTYGLGDLGGSASDFSSKLESAVKLLLGAGKVPVLAHIQYVTKGNGNGIDAASIPPFNQAIDALVAKYGLLPAPDMYAWFEAHPTQLCSSADDTHDSSGFCSESAWDGIEPTNLPGRTGVSDTIRLWAAAALAGGVYAQ